MRGGRAQTMLQHTDSSPNASLAAKRSTSESHKNEVAARMVRRVGCVELREARFVVFSQRSFSQIAPLILSSSFKFVPLRLLWQGFSCNDAWCLVGRSTV